MEILFCSIIVLAWFAVVICGAASLIIQAKRTHDWEKAGIAVLSAATVAAPLLVLAPEHVFFGIQTKGLGWVLAIMSGFSIFVYLIPLIARWWR
jgi:uncharacterized membrane protein YhaH (DUF805 family)